VTELGIGWRTDLAVLTLSGSSVEDRGDHLVIRTAQSPTYHWGNFILVTEPATIDDADRWVQVFETAFPSATWVAVGLPQLPADRSRWAAHDVEIEVDDVLVASTLPRQTEPPPGYAVRRLAGDDWERDDALAIAENERIASWESDAYAVFTRSRTEARRKLSERDLAAFFGAFVDDFLVASLGIVRCGTTARFQNVLTDEHHRGRGLASHLLGVAARWASSHGCDCWVIVTDAENPARRVYERAGLQPENTSVQGYRRPAS
jgi:GNAT superfamily N-acetyltransferase